MAKFLQCMGLAALISGLAISSLAEIGMSSPPYSQNFNSLTKTGAGSWIDDVTLPGWSILCRSFEYCVVSGYTAGTGSSSSVAVYSFGSSGSSDRALGNVASTGPANSTRFTYQLLLTNGPLLIQTNITVSYVGEQWRKSGNTSTHKLQFYYRVWPSGKGGGIAVKDLDFTSPINTSGAGALNGNSSANRRVFSNVRLPGAVVKPGEMLFLMWIEAEDSGAGHGLAIDDVSVNWSSFGLMIQCPPDVIVTNFADVPPPDVNSVSVTYDCGNRIVTHVGDNAVSNLCATTIYRTYQVSDDCNRTNSCTQIITINHPPMNDNFTNAIQVSGTSAQLSGCNFNATKETGEPSHASNPGGASVWWRWCAPANGTVTLNASSTSFERLIAVYTGSVVSNLHLVANNYATGGGGYIWYDASVTFNAFAGATYYIAVDGALERKYCCPGNFCNLCGFYEGIPVGNINMSLCVAPRIFSTNSYSILEPDGIRVYYQANANDASAVYAWRFSDANGVEIPSLAATGQTVSHLFGPFDQIPTSFQLNVSNGCDGTGTGGSFPPPCGAICLSLGVPQTLSGSAGSGPNSTSYSTGCNETFTSSNSRWFPMSKLTNAAAIAFVSAEGSAPDTVLGIFRGGINPANLTNIACNTSSSEQPARVEFETRPVNNYWLAASTTNYSALRLTYGYDLKFTGMNFNRTNGMMDIRSGPLPSQKFQLLVSTNLSYGAENWQVVLTTNFTSNVSASNNILRFVETNALANQRFYRLKLLP